MWIPFELGQTVYVVIDNGYDTVKTIRDGYDHLGELTHKETTHHPIMEVKQKIFDFRLLARFGINGIFAKKSEAQTHINNKNIGENIR